MNASVAICVPSLGTWNAKFGVALTSLVAASAELRPSIISVEHSTISIARNQLVRAALSKQCAFILFADADMTFPPDALRRLIQHNQDIVGAFYPRRTAPHEMVGCAAGFGSAPDFTKSHLGLARAAQLGAGLLLVKSSVFRRLPPPWFFESLDGPKTEANPDGLVSEDFNFIRRAIAAGFAPVVDMDLTFEVGHIGEQVLHVERPGR